MGKKHKKHKSEKHGYEELGERPLKLVLKVAGAEVTAGSSSRDTLYDEQPADYDKPREKKKKKKKDKERVSIPDDKKKERPQCVLLLPVTDLIAPGYSLVIKRPMDFSAMKDRVRKEWYQSLDELKPETIYHKAAKKLLHSGMKILSPERLQSLKQSIEFMSGLDPVAIRRGNGEEDSGASLDQSRDVHGSFYASESSQSPSTPRQDKESKEEVLKAEKELEEIRKVMAQSAGKLTNRSLQCQAGYCPVKLGMMSNRLQNGVNSLQGFREDKRNRITPVSYINHGPFTSYAPTYDSSFANVGKEDSDLIYCFYGEEGSHRASGSIAEFLAKSEEYTYKLADNLLDAMTRGEHSKSLANTERLEEQMRTPQNRDATEVVDPEASAGSRRSSLSSVMSPDPSHPDLSDGT
ncbi:hypothetical protein CRUP_022722, partial [Coryphaenoides rupestris]